MPTRSFLVKSFLAVTTAIGFLWGFNQFSVSDLPRIPGHCINYEPDDHLTAIRFGAEPVDIHFWSRNTLIDNFVEDKIGINAGVIGWANHLYVEFGNIDTNGEFSVKRRIHGFDSIMLPGAVSGKMVVGAYGGKHAPFIQDPIYDDDPHRTLCGHLQSANNRSVWDNGYVWPGETKIILEGTPEQIGQIYAESLRLAYAFNDKDYSFGLFGDDNPNSPAFFALLRQTIKIHAESFGYTISDFDPAGVDFGINWPEAAKPVLGLPSQLNPEVLEKMIADQLKFISSLQSGLAFGPRPAA